MRLWTLLFPLLLLLSGTVELSAQVTLFAEDFNDCVLPPGWDVVKTGYQDPVWYVGDAIQQDDQNGLSMNGSCFVFIDDDATGDNTPPYVIDFVSPPFDASQQTTIELNVDIHYRDWYEGEESFTVLVTDGVTEKQISRFDRGHQTGDTISKTMTLKYDLSLLTQSPHARLIFRYDDAGGYNWWAAFDNIVVTGYGEGTNILTETFNDCQLPAGWESEIVTGDDAWKIGMVDTSSKGYYEGSSMDGSCFVLFDDDLLGQAAPFSVARMATPWFDGTDFGTYLLNLDVILRYYSEKMAVYVQNGNGDENLVAESSGDIGGPFFPNYEHVTLDLSPYRSQQMRVVFEFDDGQDWGWWAGFDNVKITGVGAANDICANARPLFTGENCQVENNRTAVFDGPLTPCTDKGVGGLWYRWTPDFTGIGKITTLAQFNDVVNVFTGGCATPQLLLCDNRDEHGFAGETSFFNVQAGTEYLLRVSGRDAGFGVPRGDLCIAVNSAPAFPVRPANDDCATATNLTVNGACVGGSNANAAMSTTLPSLNELARADVWYKFTAPVLAADEQVEITSNATFSDVLTVYQGGCAALNEVAGNHKGGRLELTTLTPGTTYYLQVAGNFATVEGSLCPQVQKKSVSAPSNDNCVAATSIPIGGQCTAGSNVNASYSGLKPSCVVSVDRDVWFKFTAPISGAVRINSGAEFEHVLAVWKGDCNNLEQVFCAENPLRCDGYQLVGSLTAGQTYYVQIASWLTTAAGPATGSVCIKILDGNTPPDFQPISLQVQENCTGVGTAKLLVTANGGVAPVTLEVNPPAQVLNSGSLYLVVATDAIGCVQSLLGVVDACDAGACTLTATLTPTAPTCHDGSNGSLTVNTVGGTAPYQFKWSDNSIESALNNVPAGDYAVTVTDALGCETQLQQTLNAPAAIGAVATSTTQPGTGQSNGSIYVDVTGGNGQYSYNWTLNGGFFVASEDLTDAPAGSYQLQITDGQGCTALFEYVLTETVGTQNPSDNIFAEVYPNPAKDKATLAVAFPQPQSLLLSLTDVAGRVLHTWTVKNVTEQNIPLDLKDLPGGVYQLHVRAGKDFIVRKVTVQR